MSDDAEKPAGLGLLRAPFPDNQISKLPKESRAQIDARKADRNVSINCTICGGWHHKNAVHLDYVGHAALTDRLLDTDIEWSWEPVSFGPDGLPAFDKNGGLWIKLTVCGVTRLGYGDADGKTGGNAVKEAIGDALRNAAMRFGAALDLWHKGDLHGGTDEDAQSALPAADRQERKPQGDSPEAGAKDYLAKLLRALAKCQNAAEVDALAKKEGNGIARLRGEFAPQFADWQKAVDKAYTDLDDIPF